MPIDHGCHDEARVGETMAMPQADHIPSTVRLGDGRQLAYERSREPGARPVLFCHGTPGSRLFRPPDPTLPTSLDVDLVTVDRPGYGRSTRQPHRALLDWPADVGALADRLGWDRFARPDVAAVVRKNAAQALAGNEVAHEMVLLRRNWGFGPADIAVPVVLWHGEADRNVPVAHGRRLAALLPECRATFVPEAGHYLIFDRWREVLAGTTEKI
jgi:pimeloyl-ACP methyl ester carboxylesterase